MDSFDLGIVLYRLEALYKEALGDVRTWAEKFEKA